VRWIVDRVENGLAVCESQDGQRSRLVHAASLPHCREGDVWEEKAGVWTLLTEETQARRAQIHTRFTLLREHPSPPDDGKERHE